MAQPDHVAIGELPLLHRRVVDRRAVRRIEVGQQCHLAVPADFQVTTRNTGVGQAELSVLAAADDVRALTQLVGAAAAVVELQRDGGAGRGVVALAVAVATGLRAGRSRIRRPGVRRIPARRIRHRTRRSARSRAGRRSPGPDGRMPDRRSRPDPDIHLGLGSHRPALDSRPGRDRPAGHRAGRSHLRRAAQGDVRSRSRPRVPVAGLACPGGRSQPGACR